MRKTLIFFINHFRQSQKQSRLSIQEGTLLGRIQHLKQQRVFCKIRTCTYPKTYLHFYTAEEIYFPSKTHRIYSHKWSLTFQSYWESSEKERYIYFGKNVFRHFRGLNWECTGWFSGQNSFQSSSVLLFKWPKRARKGLIFISQQCTLLRHSHDQDQN